MRRLVARLGGTGRVYRPPTGGEDIEAILLEWIGDDPRHREQALQWLNHPPPPSVDEHGRPPLSWSHRELELRRPIETALGGDDHAGLAGFIATVHRRWLPRPLRRRVTGRRVRRRLR
jgi:hypothetical protein